MSMKKYLVNQIKLFNMSDNKCNYSVDQNLNAEFAPFGHRRRPQRFS